MKPLKEKLSTNINDHSAHQFQNELLTQLETELNQFNTTTTNEHTLYLKGQKNMLKQIIEYIDTINCGNPKA